MTPPSKEQLNTPPDDDPDEVGVMNKLVGAVKGGLHHAAVAAMSLAVNGPLLR